MRRSGGRLLGSCSLVALLLSIVLFGTCGEGLSLRGGLRRLLDAHQGLLRGLQSQDSDDVIDDNLDMVISSDYAGSLWKWATRDPWPKKATEWWKTDTLECVGDPDECCPSLYCRGAALERDPDRCLKLVGKDCPFKIKGIGHYQWKARLPEVDAGCFNGMNGSFIAPLPPAVTNSKAVWSKLSLTIQHVNMNNTENCWTTDWLVRVVNYTALTNCEVQIDTHDSLTHRLSVANADVKMRVSFKWSETGPYPGFQPLKNGYNNLRDRYYAQFRLDSILGERQYRDHAGVLITPTVKDCNFSPSQNSIARENRKQATWYFGDWNVHGYYKASGRIWGEKDNSIPFNAPINLQVPESLQFKHAPSPRAAAKMMRVNSDNSQESEADGAAAHEKLAAAHEDEAKPGDDEEDDDQNRTLPEEAPAVAHQAFSSCDPEVLRTQLDKIHQGAMILNPNCDWDKLYVEVFGTENAEEQKFEEIAKLQAELAQQLGDDAVSPAKLVAEFSDALKDSDQNDAAAQQL